MKKNKMYLITAFLLAIIVLIVFLQQDNLFSITAPITCENKEYVCNQKEFSCFIRNIEVFSQAADGSISPSKDLNNSTMSFADINSALATACLNTIGVPSWGDLPTKYSYKNEVAQCGIEESGSILGLWGVGVNGSLVTPQGSYRTGTDIIIRGFSIYPNNLCFKNIFYGQPAPQIETYECKYKQQCPTNTPTMTYDCVNNTCVGTQIYAPAPPQSDPLAALGQWIGSILSGISNFFCSNFMLWC